MADNPFQLLLLQIVLILVVARVCGRLLRVVGQPQVVGEMFAGILLGPSVFGRMDGGHLLGVIFPESSRGNLEIFSQLGVILFMFLVGLELDFSGLVRQGSAVVLTAAASMLVPFGLGLGLALWMLRLGYGPGQGGTELGFVLFMGTGLCITAFPVLARILSESDLQRTQIGMIAIACAAMNDLGGWCILAVVLAFTQAGGSTGQILVHAGMTVGLAAGYLGLMILVVRPLLVRMGSLFNGRGFLGADLLAVIFILLTASALATDRIGIHALFGAFMLGAVMPSEPRLVAHLTDKIQDLATLFLLPLFFAYTGLHTDLGLLAAPAAWGMAGIITVVATVGKVGGTFLAAGRLGLGRRHALALGVLMNTRGLMELIILNLALSVHAIDLRVFSMMVIMTLITTVLTAPVVGWLLGSATRRIHLIANKQDSFR